MKYSNKFDYFLCFDYPKNEQPLEIINKNVVNNRFQCKVAIKKNQKNYTKTKGEKENKVSFSS